MHKVLESKSGSLEGEPQSAEQVEKSTEFIGLITLRSMNASNLTLPEDLTLPDAAATTILTVELAYLFLPTVWGKGFATESIEAAFESCKRARSFWAPFSKLYVRALVNQANPASARVMDKTGMTNRGIYTWTGNAVFLAGKWRERDDLYVFGMHLLK